MDGPFTPPSLSLKVRWVVTEPGEDLCLYSVAQDGRLTQWHVHSSMLVYTDLIQFRSDQPRAAQPQDRVALEGVFLLN